MKIQVYQYLKLVISKKISNLNDDDLYKLSNAVDDLLDVTKKFLT